ncbi:site-specific tyrosine recombinase XerC [Myxococcota bacterium]
MPKRGSRKPKAPVGDPNDPDGLYVWMKRYLEALRVKNYSPRTVDNRESYLGFFIQWCETRSILRPQEVTKPILERYQRHLFHLRKENGRPLSFRAQHARLVPVRGYFKWLTRQNVLLWNPASELELPRLERRLPKHVLTATEAEQVLEQPNISDPMGVRDRAILETLYSTGIRRMEVINLSVYDLDAERGTLMVRLGKGKKDRMVPIGERAILWIEKYLNDVRPTLVVPPDESTLFLTNLGDALSPNRLTQMVREYIDAAELGKRGACHLFRHTMATLMHDNGADARFIQEMLGHVELSTTQIYTQVSIRKLKEIHALTHPAAKLEPAPGIDEPSNESPSARGAHDDDDTATATSVEELFSHLAAEEEEEAALVDGEAGTLDDTSVDGSSKDRS